MTGCGEPNRLDPGMACDWSNAGFTRGVRKRGNGCDWLLTQVYATGRHNCLGSWRCCVDHSIALTSPSKTVPWPRPHRTPILRSFLFHSPQRRRPSMLSRACSRRAARSVVRSVASASKQRRTFVQPSSADRARIVDIPATYQDDGHFTPRSGTSSFYCNIVKF